MKRLLFLACMVLFSGRALATNEGWKLLRKDHPPFRFEFPPTWVEKTPRGENVKALVSSNNPETGANCNVIVRVERELEGLGPAEAIAALGGPEGVGAMLAEGQPGARVVSSRMSALDGRQAVLARMTLQYSTVRGAVDIEQLTLWSIVDASIVQIVCVSKAASFAGAEPTFIQIFSTVVLESWKQ